HPDGEAQSSEDGQGSQSGDQQSGGESQPGEDSGEAEVSDAENQSESCGTANLVPGTLVKEAELEVGSEGAVFHSVDLIG
ncbi:MAG TPA: hypothetical protein VF770_08020, partial [Solirubrobacterales bacterium]